MSDDRRMQGRETWNRLLEWDQGQAPSERLAARLLTLEHFVSIDPSHPLGGKDGGKDIACERDGRKFIVACYFPRGQQTFGTIETKYTDDVEKIRGRGVDGLVFFTNQEITLGERASLAKIAEPLVLDLYHLERIAAIMDTPSAYGLRLEFLNVGINKEELISGYSTLTFLVSGLQQTVASLTRLQTLGAASPMKTVPVETLAGYTATGYVSAVFPTKVKTCTCGEIFQATKNLTMQSVVFDPNAIDVVKCPNCARQFAF